MKNVSYTWLMLLFIFTIAESKPTSTDDNKSLAWKISGKHMHKPSYLFGTIHLICPEDYIWTKKMEESLEKSEDVCFELNLADPQVTIQIATGFIDPNKNLKDYFSEKQYSAIEKYLSDTLQMNISIFQHIKPVMLETFLEMRNISCPGAISYEETIMKDAQKSNKTIEGLEEPQEQIKLLENIPTDIVINDILDFLNGNVAGKDEFEKLVSAYKMQDLPALYTLLKDAKITGEGIGPFVDDRNKKWIGRMEEKMEQKSVFFAVGAGHLWGEKGLINLLRKAGYTVESFK